jgi:hypothetical protein
VLATTDHGTARRPLGAPAARGDAKVVPLFPPAANLCPGCGPVASELSSRYCDQHGAALRSALQSWRVRSAHAV